MREGEVTCDVRCPVPDTINRVIFPACIRRRTVGGSRASDQLDAALRQAFYVDRQCISIPSIILDVARTRPDIDVNQLGRRIAQGAGVAAICNDFEHARSIPIQGSPFIEAPDGTSGSRLNNVSLGPMASRR